MNHQSKLVAVMLTFAFVIMPAAVLGACSDGMAQMAGTSGMDMAGMVMPPVSATLSRAPNSNCCIISSAEVVASSALPNSQSPGTPMPSALVTRVAQPVRTFIAAQTFLVSTPPTQAVLCVFLI